ncbi:unnamed protein product, partial [Vitis vinifera]
MEIDKGSHGPASTNALLQWSQWQLLDSILPTGGFAHSCGLEAAFQAHMISGPEDLQTYVLHVLENTGSLLLPFVYSANICNCVFRNVISAATRLNLIGPLGAAKLQHDIAIAAEEMSKKWMNRKFEEACQTAPLLDTVQGCHAYLFSRLFCS